MVTADSPVVLLSRSWTNQSFIQSSDCCFLTCIQVSQETGKMVWCSHLSKIFPQFLMIHTVKGFSIVHETEIDVFLKFPCFLYNPMNVGNLISSSSIFSKPSLNIWKFLVHVMLKSSMHNFKHDLACLMVSTFFGTTLFGNWDLLHRPKLEEEIATHFSILAWEIPWTEEPSRLQSLGSQRVGHDWATKQHQQHRPTKEKYYKDFGWVNLFVLSAFQKNHDINLKNKI